MDDDDVLGSQDRLLRLGNAGRRLLLPFGLRCQQRKFEFRQNERLDLMADLFRALTIGRREIFAETARRVGMPLYDENARHSRILSHRPCARLARTRRTRGHAPCAMTTR